MTLYKKTNLEKEVDSGSDDTGIETLAPLM